MGDLLVVIVIGDEKLSVGNQTPRGGRGRGLALRMPIVLAREIQNARDQVGTRVVARKFVAKPYLADQVARHLRNHGHNGRTVLATELQDDLPDKPADMGRAT